VAEVLAEAVPDDEVVRRTVVVSLGVHLAIDWTIEG